jgi:hypothetical protein
LGKLEDLGNGNTYHVITNFTITGIGLMLSPRGHSEVAFIDEKLNKIIIYDVGMPYVLPKSISKNILHFEIENAKVGIYISEGLPPYLCVPKNGCY